MTTIRDSDDTPGLAPEQFILALLNSRVLDFFLKQVSTPLRGGFFRYFTQYVEQLPIKRIDSVDPDLGDKPHKTAQNMDSGESTSRLLL